MKSVFPPLPFQHALLPSKDFSKKFHTIGAVHRHRVTMVLDTPAYRCCKTFLAMMLHYDIEAVGIFYMCRQRCFLIAYIHIKTRPEVYLLKGSLAPIILWLSPVPRTLSCPQVLPPQRYLRPSCALPPCL